MYTRFDKVPDKAGGDFNCKVQQSSLYKDFKYFSGCIFYSDELHHNSHVACSNAYSVKYFKNIFNRELMYINDSSPEQRNRIINKLKYSLMYSSLPVFMITIKLVMMIDNRMIIRRLEGLDSYLKTK